MAARAMNQYEIARRYCLGTIKKWLLIRNKTPEEVFMLSKPTWLSRDRLESDFTLEELRRACCLLQIPEAEQIQLLTGGFQ